jgi:hypothetical protein
MGDCMNESKEVVIMIPTSSKNRDFLAELKRICQRGVDKYPTHKPERRPVKLYKLVAIDGEHRREVGWNLLYDDALLLANALVRRIKRLNEPNDGGGPLFEITQHEVTLCQENS